MSISATEIATKVLQRLEADTGSGGLFNASSPLVTAAWWDQAPATATTPYIVFDVSLAQGEGEAFETNSVQVLVRIAVFVTRWMSGNGMERMSAILARIYGDSGANAGVPSVGLHRWKMTGLTNWEATQMQFQGQESNGDEDRVAVESRFIIKAISQSW